jgi:16S rRNA (cytidine1402-2'-O)-methyltransferase
MGILYVVATPIGNLEDISLRALRILHQVSLIAAEDTRTARKLLSQYDIHTPVTSYFEHSKLTKLDYLLDALSDRDVAIISEAGMPGLSDPGYELIRAAIARGVPVVPIPGPSALVTALAVSGLPTDQFVYLGFLPRQKSQRRRLLESVANEQRTLVAFEAPHRLRASLDDVRDILGDRAMTAARELTKLFEEIVRGRVSEVAKHFAESQPRGEFTLVIAGAAEPVWDEAQVQAALAERQRAGLSGKDAVREVVRLSGWPRREVYRLWLGEPHPDPLPLRRRGNQRRQ